mgnify:CR=1 FL=1
MPARQTTTARLDRQISVQQRTAGVDARGQAAETWTNVLTGVWACQEPLRAREYFAAGTMQVPTDVRYTIRYRTGITAGMRVVDAGTPYEIAGNPIDVDGQRRTLELMCIAGTRGAR